MNPRNVVKLLIPPIVLGGWRIIQSRQGRDFGLIGDYSSWNEAVAASTGYDTDLILEKTTAVGGAPLEAVAPSSSAPKAKEVPEDVLRKILE